MKAFAPTAFSPENEASDLALERCIGFSTRLRSLIAQRGLPLTPALLAREFAFSREDAGTTAQTFSNWLNGVQMPRRTTLHVLAEWLHTTPEFLESGVNVLQFRSAAPAASDEDADLVQLFARLDPYGKRVVRAMLQSMVSLKAQPA